MTHPTAMLSRRDCCTDRSSRAQARGGAARLWRAAAAALILSLSSVARTDEPQAPIDALPAAYRARAVELVALEDPEARATALRELSRDAGPAVLPLLVYLRETDPSPRVRERSVRYMRGLRDPIAIAALEEAARSDAEGEVSLRALEELHAIWSSRMLELVDARLDRLRAEPPSVGARAASAGDGAYAALLAAQEHWMVVARGGMLPPFMREAPPRFEAAPPDRQVRIVAFGDFGSGETDQLETAAAIARFHAREPLDFGITLGDNFYPNGVESLADPLWSRAWTEPYAKLEIPFYPTLGNHDWGFPGSPAAEILYRDEGGSWNMPAARYTFTAGPAQLFALDTNALSDAQLDWLDREIERSDARWKIVYGHHPIRSHGQHGDDPFVADLLPLLRDRVDLYIAGHEHDMQVLEPESGVHFVISGAGGKSIRETQSGPNTRFASSTFGFTVLDVDSERIRVRMIDREPRTLYEMEIEPRSR